MSTLKADTIVASDGTSPVTLTKQSAAKAWIDHNQVTSHSIRDSFNISSITDAGTGKTYPISFTNSMSSSSYAGSMYSSANTTDSYATFNNQNTGGLGSKTTSSFGHNSYSSTHVDAIRNDNIIHGDLA
jgi:hypothetical protein